MKVVFETRFSFYGQSGWKSAAAGDPALLFAPDRLEARLGLFEAITLPSLAAQTDPAFGHLVLSSTLMPDAYRTRLRELVLDTLGAARAQVLFRPEGSAGAHFRTAVTQAHGDAICAQVVLDDDDAVARDYVEVLHRYAAAALADRQREEDYVFLSFPRGYTLLVDDGVPAGLEHRYVPYTNLGLALVAPASHRRNPFMTSHRRIGQRHPSLMVTGRRPYYLRALHGHNDSNAHRQEKALSAADVARAFDHFPLLAAYFAADGSRRKVA